MMTDSRIVVGVNDSPGARSACGWAAAEWRIRGGQLVIVHVPAVPRPEPIAGTGPDGIGPNEPELAGLALLDELVSGIRSRYPDIPVKTLLGHGDPAGSLIDLSALSDLMVLGTTGSGSNLTSLIGSVSSRVAAQAHCPVAVVPELLPARTTRSGEPTIVVGISDTDAGRAALRFAFEEAACRRVGVTAVRGWEDGDPGSEAAASLAQRQAAARQLRAIVAGSRRDYPDVRVRSLLLHAHPAQAVLQATRDAELLVIGSHHSGNRWSSRLGPVPQTILHHTSCPVVLIGTPHRLHRPVSDGFAG
ncbi:MAG TPA: universal stress protein [Jatrophihabitans sp.]|nr:universal stress protein [Jatrophihabitans sp.]